MRGRIGAIPAAGLNYNGGAMLPQNQQNDLQPLVTQLQAQIAQLQVEQQQLLRDVQAQIPAGNGQNNANQGVLPAGQQGVHQPAGGNAAQGQQAAVPGNQQNQAAGAVAVQAQPPPAAAPRRRQGPTRPAAQGDETPALITPNGVAAALQEIMGVGDNTGDAYCDAFLDGTSVDQKLKEKIWDGADVNLSALLPKFELDFRFTTPTINPKNLFNQNVNSARQPSSVIEWLEMFNVFASVYCEKYDGAGACLFGYANRIIELQREEPTSYMWLIYDILFRHLKAKCPALKWHVIYPACQRKARYYAEKHKNKSNVSFRGAAGRGRGRGGPMAGTSSQTDYTCNVYNRGELCQFRNCRFSHSCSVCKGSHPKVHCKGGRQNSTSTSSSAAKGSK